MLWTHNTSVLYLVLTNAFVLGWAWARRRWPGEGDALQPPRFRVWIGVQVLVLALWSPWLWAFVRQSAAVYRRFWLPAPTWATVVAAVRDFCCAFLPQRITWAWAVWALYGALFCLGTYCLRGRPARLGLLLALSLGPIAGEWLVSFWRPIFYDRTLIWASIPFYVLLALGIRQLRYRSFVLVAVAIVATLGILSVGEYDRTFEKEGWDDAAAYVAGRFEPGDLILFHATWVQIPFDYYWRDHGLSADERGVPVDLFARGVLEPQMTTDDLPRLRELTGDRERVWLVYSHQWYTDPQGLVPSALGESMTVQSRRRFYGVEVRLYLSL
jgi:hypothetical protein